MAVQQISGPTALGTRILSPGIGSRYTPPLSLPAASYRRPVRAVYGDGDDDDDDDNVYHVPTPPIMIRSNPNANDLTGRFLTVPILPPPAAHITAPSPVLSSSSPVSSSPHSPSSDYIPILHQPVPKLGKTPAKTPMLVIVPPPPPSSSEADGFTPVTPSPSPRSRGFRRIRVSQLPRDALGIATAGFARMRSQRAVGGYDDDDDDDREPLSPPYDAPAKAKTTRRTLFGVLEGWWDLGLLERGKSLRRK